MKMRVKIAYLDASGAKINFLEFADEFKDNKWMYFLYRPGHYEYVSYLHHRFLSPFKHAISFINDKIFIVPSLLPATGFAAL